VVYEPWSGFYLGVNAGYSAGLWTSNSFASIFPSDSGFLTKDTPNLASWQAGLHAGFNWLIDGSWLMGIEADIQATGARANSDGFGTTTTSTSNNVIVTTQTSSNQWQLPWLATLRGRIGGLADAGTLIYVTAGPVVGQFKFASQTTLTTQLFDATGTIPQGPPVTVVGPSFAQSAVRIGATAGIGVEQKFLGNWSGRLEYLYLDFGSFTFLSGTGVDTKVQLRDNIVRMGVSYTFRP
jgi:outer membrane immunogenic protein